MFNVAHATVMLACLAVAPDESLFVTRPSPDGEAVVRVDPSRTGEPISRRLFGKFAEHLHHNIYHGMWAQVVRNPSFEDWPLFFMNDDRMTQARQQAVDSGQPWPEGLAAHWRSQGEGDVVYSLDPDSINTNTSQHIAVKFLKTRAVGLRQDDVYLPLHRESDFDVSLYARARGIKAVDVVVRADKRELGRLRFSGLSDGWRKLEGRLRLQQRAGKGKPLTVALEVSEAGDLWLDQLLIFPADNVYGFDRDVVDLTRDAQLSLLRYPGGNFVSGYHWRDGIGPVDQRPMRRNPAWNCPEYNHVGTDEFMAFCEAVGCEPMICVNAGNGTAAEAARWVEYCNGSIETPLGTLRADHGHPRPYNVRYWEIGNEIYGGWQVGHCTAEDYVKRYRAFVEAMRKVDPNIRFIANGNNADWHAPLLKAHPELVRSFSLHPLIGMSIPRTSDPTNAYLSLMAYPEWYRDWLLELADQMKSAGVEPKLAITELQIFTNKRELPNNNSLSEAVYMARYFHTAIRLGGLVEMLTHSAMVNHGGGLRKERGVVYPQPSWWATHLYGTMRGTIPLAIDVQTPVYDVEQDKMPTVKGAPFIDAVALMDGSRSLISLMVINAHPKEKIQVKIDLTGWPMPSTLTGRRIVGPSFMSHNTIDKPNVVRIHEIREPANIQDGKLRYASPPHSVTELVFSK